MSKYTYHKGYGHYPRRCYRWTFLGWSQEAQAARAERQK